MYAGLVVSEGTWWLVSTEFEIILEGMLVLSDETCNGLPASINGAVSVDGVEDSADF